MLDVDDSAGSTQWSTSDPSGSGAAPSKCGSDSMSRRTARAACGCPPPSGRSRRRRRSSARPLPTGVPTSSEAMRLGCRPGLPSPDDVRVRRPVRHLDPVTAAHPRLVGRRPALRDDALQPLLLGGAQEGLSVVERVGHEHRCGRGDRVDQQPASLGVGLPEQVARPSRSRSNTTNRAGSGSDRGPRARLDARGQQGEGGTSRVVEDHDLAVEHGARVRGRPARRPRSPGSGRTHRLPYGS